MFPKEIQVQLSTNTQIAEMQVVWKCKTCLAMPSPHLELPTTHSRSPTQIADYLYFGN